MITHKRGRSFDKALIIPDTFADGFFIGFTPKAELRDQSGTLVATFNCAWADPVTTRNLMIQQLDTNTWPTTSCVFDVRFRRESDGYTKYTNTETVLIVKNVTT